MGRRSWAIVLLCMGTVLLAWGSTVGLQALARVGGARATLLAAVAVAGGLAAVIAATALIARLRVLRGYIPICAACKQVRDEAGVWNRLEAYLEERSHAEFTHGFCGACMADLRARTLSRRGAPENA